MEGSNQEEVIEITGRAINPDEVKYIIFDDFDYHFNRMLSADVQNWKCMHKSCLAYFNVMEGRKIFTGIMEHTHLSQGKIQVINQEEAKKVTDEDLPIKQKIERSGAKRSPVENEPSCSYWNLSDDSSIERKRIKRGSSHSLSVKNCETPSSVTLQPAAVSSNAVSGSAFPPVSVGHNAVYPSPFQAAALSRNAVNPSETNLPSSSPSFPEMSPRVHMTPPLLAPPLSGQSSQPEEDHVSPLPSIAGSSVPTTPTRQPPFKSNFLELLQQSNSTLCNFPQLAAKTSDLDKPWHSLKPQARSALSAKLAKYKKYKEFEKNVLLLDNEGFGQAVTFMLMELPPEEAKDLRFEIATLLYGAIEVHED